MDFPNNYVNYEWLFSENRDNGKFGSVKRSEFYELLKNQYINEYIEMKNILKKLLNSLILNETKEINEINEINIIENNIINDIKTLNITKLRDIIAIIDPLKVHSDVTSYIGECYGLNSEEILTLEAKKVKFSVNDIFIRFQQHLLKKTLHTKK